MMLRSASRYARGGGGGGLFSATSSVTRSAPPSATTCLLRRALGTNGASSVGSRREPPAATTAAAAKREAQPLTSTPHVQHLKAPTCSHDDDAQQQLLEQQQQQQEEEPQLSWRQRAKTFALEYGRVGVCTHIALSLMSFSAIYAGVSAGLDVSALLDTVGFSVTTSESATNSAGSFVVAYAIYKLMSPVRWPLTFAVTPVVLRALRRRGYMLPALSAGAAASTAARRSPPPPPSASPPSGSSGSS